MINRETVERYWTAFKDGDLDAYEACLATDVVVTYPQSGEVLRGRADYMSTIRNYPVNLPSGEEELARLDISEKAICVLDWNVHHCCHVGRKRGCWSERTLVSERRHVQSLFDLPSGEGADHV
jgi:ketosteroid isomerase-like protein